MTAAAPQLPVWPAGVSLLLGLGAQKAGTTWLHETLRTHPDCHAFPIKEVHYFDTISGQTQVGYSLTYMRLQAMRAQGGAGDDERRVQQLAHLFDDPEDSLQDYVTLMTEGLPAGSVALDITPAYAMMDDAQFSEAAQMPQTRFLFIMREPVARYWSGVRMLVGMRSRGLDALSHTGPFETQAQALVDQLLNGVSPDARRKDLAVSDYAAVLDKLKRFVPAPRQLVLFFEDLFTQASLDRICAFLGIKPMVLSDTNPRLKGIKASPRPDQIARLTEFFRPQYEAVCDAFADAVPQAWHDRFCQDGLTMRAPTDMRRRLHQ